MKAILQLLGLLLGFLPIILFMCLFSWLRRSAKNHKPRQEGSALEFAVAPGMRILLRSILVALCAFSVLVMWASRSAGDGLIAVLIPISVLIAIVLARPRPVVVDHNGIRQRRWIREDRAIAWHEIVSVRRGSNTGTTYVRSRSGGRPISFSPLLVGQSRFVREVRAHARQCDDFDDE
jgi:hypothetical protein